MLSLLTEDQYNEVCIYMCVCVCVCIFLNFVILIIWWKKIVKFTLVKKIQFFSKFVPKKIVSQKNQKLHNSLTLSLSFSL